MTKEIATGTLVIVPDGGSYVYGGPNDNDEFIAFVFGGGPTEVLAAVQFVAPADEVILNPKDSRIAVKNDPGNRPTSWGGSWRMSIPGQEHDRWFRTKREAVASAAARLAIADWHSA